MGMVLGQSKKDQELREDCASPPGCTSFGGYFKSHQRPGEIRHWHGTDHLPVRYGIDIILMMGVLYLY